VTLIKLPRGQWEFDPSQRLGAAGGFGEVFVGVGSDGGTVAVKRLHLTATDAAHRELRMAERLMFGAMRHVIPVLDAGQDADSDRYYIVMARAERSLQDEITSHGGPLPFGEAINAALQICDGLVEVQDIVHRDLKPANVLRHERCWKIADFGIARFIEESTSLNTLKNCLSPQYAAPEQWRMETATAATDIYALGCILYAVLNGAPPFHGPPNGDYREQHLRAAPAPLMAIDPRIVSLVASMLRKAPETRPSLERVTSVLRSVVSTPAPAIRRAASALQAAAAVEAQRRTQIEAQRAVESQELLKRQALADEGIGIFAELVRNIALAARECGDVIHVTENGDNLNVSLGLATLTMALTPTHPTLPRALPLNEMPLSKWDAILSGTVSVTQERDPRWSHGATLWFMRLPTNTDYRWFEVSYKNNALFPQRTARGPFSVTGEAADRAASVAMTEIGIESGPTPIDGEDAHAFVDRWLERLVLAYHGRLQPF
jgi:hypothetical protein